MKRSEKDHQKSDQQRKPQNTLKKKRILTKSETSELWKTMASRIASIKPKILM